MTALSCLALGIAFVIAVGLLVFAGIVLGWLVPLLIERWRASKRGAPPNRR